MAASSGSDGMTLPRGEGESITGKNSGRETRNEPSKQNKRRQGKKEARKSDLQGPNKGQIILDSGSIWLPCRVEFAQALFLPNP
jgi:hypothetical protein